MNQPVREHWKSRLGFILATSGAAIGLGNIQRFPYLTAKFGGGLFVFFYLISVLLLGIPLILNEFAIGRHSQRNPFAALRAIKSQGPWKYVGLLGVAVAFFILSYYLVISGWTLGYVFSLSTGHLPDLDAFSSDPFKVFGCEIIFLLATILVVQGGLEGGIERWSKIIMPLLLGLLLLLMIRSLSLPNSWEGLKFYFSPNWSEFHPKILLYAVSQAFFSLCVGEAVLITYGSYATKRENLVTSAVSIAFFDTLVALLAGLVIFPALFSSGESPHQGMGLIFHVIPTIFLDLPFGHLFGAAFFLMLSFAAFTTCIALLEIPVAFVIESTSLSRKQATWILGSCALLISVPSALSKGANDYFTQFSLPWVEEVGFYDIMDFIWGGLGMVIGGLFLSIFTGWVWGTKNAVQELQQGCPHFTWQGRVWGWIIQYLAPIIILAILASIFFGSQTEELLLIPL